MSFVTNVITQAAQKYGVAPWIALDIAQLESHNDPNAVGDHGTSFGLFQLHWGGQGTGYTAAQLKDPVRNADIGVSHMAGAYRQGTAQGLQGYQLLDYVATHSGHPGYAGPGHYPSYESTLEKVYASNGGTNGATPLPASYSPVPMAEHVTNSNDPIQMINDAMQLNGGFSLLNPVANAKPVFFRVITVICGLLCILFGLFAVAQKVLL